MTSEDSRFPSSDWRFKEKLKKSKNNKTAQNTDDRFAHFSGESPSDISSLPKVVNEVGDIEYAIPDEETSQIIHPNAIQVDNVDDLSSDSEDDEDEEYISSAWNDVSEELIPVEKFTETSTSKYLAIIGPNWDIITATDLYILFSTFIRDGTSIDSPVKSVEIYQSNYGIEKMKIEEEKGPSLDEWDHVEMETRIPDEEERKNEYLRLYQRQRVKYYFGVIEFNSLEACDYAYREMDGMMTKFCPTTLDLRVISNEDYTSMISGREISQFCDDIPKNYEIDDQLVNFQDKNAMGIEHTKVDCSWDTKADLSRQKFVKKVIDAKDIADMDLKNYLASDSEDEVDNVANIRSTLGFGDLGDSDDDSEDDGETSPKESQKKSNSLEKSNSLFSDDEDDGNKTMVFDTKFDDFLFNKEEGETTVSEEKKDDLPRNKYDEYLLKKKAKKKDRKKMLKEKIKNLKAQRVKEHQNALLNANRENDGNEDSDDETRRILKRKKIDKKSIDSRFSKRLDESADFVVDPTIPEFKKGLNDMKTFIK